MFRSNPDLGIMDQAYMKLKTQSEQLEACFVGHVTLLIIVARSTPATSLETIQARNDRHG